MFTTVLCNREPLTGLVWITFYSDRELVLSFSSDTVDIARSRAVWIIQAYGAPFQIEA